MCRDYWARFERFVRQLAASCKEVYVITGPLYLPTQTASGYMMNYPLIGMVQTQYKHQIKLPPASAGHLAGSAPFHSMRVLQPRRSLYVSL